jgi:hypothetical protein
MSFIKNIEIWNNQKPRVCSFDLEDYCTAGLIGNNTTGLSGIQTERCYEPGNCQPIYRDDIWATARATSDAWMKAVNEYILAVMAHYVDNESQEGTPFHECVTEAEWNAMWDLINGPQGPYMKFMDFAIKRDLFFNSLMPSSLKRTDVGSGLIRINIRPYDGPRSDQAINYTIDFKTLLYPTQEAYLEYTKALRDVVQSVDRVMKAINNDSYPIYQP